MAGRATGKPLPAGMRVRFWLWAALLRPLKHLVPLRTLVRLVRMRHRACAASPEHVAGIVAYMGAAGKFPARAPANCLERSLAAYRLLRAAGARPELRVGVRRLAGSRSLDGHVWLMLDGTPVAERTPFIDEFTPMLRVDSDGRFESLGRSPGASGTSPEPRSVS